VFFIGQVSQYIVAPLSSATRGSAALTFAWCKLHRLPALAPYGDVFPQVLGAGVWQAPAFRVPGSVLGASQAPRRSRQQRDPRLSLPSEQQLAHRAVGIHPGSAALRKCTTKTPLPSSSGWTTETSEGPRAKPPARRCQRSSLPAGGEPCLQLFE